MMTAVAVASKSLYEKTLTDRKWVISLAFLVFYEFASLGKAYGNDVIISVVNKCFMKSRA